MKERWRLTVQRTKKSPPEFVCEATSDDQCWRTLAVLGPADYYSATAERVALD